MLDVQTQEVSSLAMQPGTIPGQTVWAPDSSSVITVGIIYTYLQYLQYLQYYIHIYTYLHVSTHIYTVYLHISTPCRWRVLTPGARAPRALTRPRGWCG